MGILFKKYQPLKKKLSQKVLLKMLRSLLKSIKKGLRHQLLEDFKKAEKNKNIGENKTKEHKDDF